jgi:hypothetical protein
MRAGHMAVWNVIISHVCVCVTRVRVDLSKVNQDKPFAPSFIKFDKRKKKSDTTRKKQHFEYGSLPPPLQLLLCAVLSAYRQQREFADQRVSVSA